MESEKYICVRERVGEQNQVAIIDVDEPSGIVRRPITAESAIMHPQQKIIALKAGKQLQVFNLETKSKLKSHLLTEEVTYWRWIGPSTLALVTDQSVFHWTVEGAAEEPPKKIFDRLPSMAGCQIISYRTDSTGRWLALVGISSQQGRVVGSLQLFHTDKAVSQPIEGHAACFAEFKAEGAQHSTKIFSFAVRTHSAAKVMIL